MIDFVAEIFPGVDAEVFPEVATGFGVGEEGGVECFSVFEMTFGDRAHVGAGFDRLGLVQCHARSLSLPIVSFKWNSLRALFL